MRLFTALSEYMRSLFKRPDNINTKILSTFTVDGRTYKYWDLNKLETLGFENVARLPKSQKVLLESLLRRYDGVGVTHSHLTSLVEGNTAASIPYLPARVVLQDFTGVPLFVDLAAMRDAAAEAGKDPQFINPVLPCDLVIDHSVQVDYFGSPEAQKLNEQREFERNKERYQFLKWAQSSFSNVRIIPSATGIVHQVNLEYLSSIAYLTDDNFVYSDTCIGTDSHTPMVNGIGVLAWGVGGIEAESAMLGQSIALPVPEVVGIRLSGELPEGSTATDLVLRITQLCREAGVVGKFVEFYGPGVSQLSAATRATVSNMAPEQGCTVSFFPVDEETLRYLKSSGRTEHQVNVVRSYAQAQGLWYEPSDPEPIFSQTIELDLGSITPCVAGPKRPQDRIALKDLGREFCEMLTEPANAARGFNLNSDELEKDVSINRNGETHQVGHGLVAIAAITSCTNTSNPSVMIAAGLLAKRAVELGLNVPSYVKTSLAPGSRVVESYLRASGLLPYLEELGFHIVGYGCTTCIGNSGPLPEEVAEAIEQNNLVASAVLSGNRNFEGRIHALIQGNFLASPPLVVAYALLGSTAKDITSVSLGKTEDGSEVFLADIWPSNREIQAVIDSCITPEMYRERYKQATLGSTSWQELSYTESPLYEWDTESTYIQRPPFFSGQVHDWSQGLRGARVLGLFGDSVTTDHISPAGSIAYNSPAARYLISQGVDRKDFNSYGSRRGNDRVMARGTFSNIRLKNLLANGQTGNVTLYHPSGELTTFFEASQKYQDTDTPLIILAGKFYGNGSSRDWASKGPGLLGVQAVIFESCERIHRSNLIGMGILPLQFLEGESAESLGLQGDEIFSIEVTTPLTPLSHAQVTATAPDRETVSFEALIRIDTPSEVEYFLDGGILQTVLKQLLI